MAMWEDWWRAWVPGYCCKRCDKAWGVGLLLQRWQTALLSCFLFQNVKTVGMGSGRWLPVTETGKGGDQEKGIAKPRWSSYRRMKSWKNLVLWPVWKKVNFLVATVCILSNTASCEQDECFSKQKTQLALKILQLLICVKNSKAIGI